MVISHIDIILIRFRVVILFVVGFLLYTNILSHVLIIHLSSIHTYLMSLSDITKL